MYLNYPRALAMMERDNLGGLVVTAPKNLSYVTGYRSSGVDIDAYGILPRSPESLPTLVMAHRALVSLAANPSWIENILTFEQTQYASLFPQPGAAYDQLVPTTPTIEAEMRRLLNHARNLQTNDGLEGLAQALRELGLEESRLGFDDLEVAEELKAQHLPELVSRGAHDILRRIRLVKTPEEMQNLRRAAELTQEALKETINVAGEGADVAEVADAFRLAAVKRGAVPAGHGGFLTGSAERGLAAQYHHRMKQGEVFLFGCVASYQGYFSDFVRTVVVGPPSEEQTKAHHLLESSFDRLNSIIGPGINTSEIAGAIADTVVTEGGDIGRLALNIHSMGQDIVEIQHHMRQPGFMLEPGVCFCVYPLYKSAEAGDVFSIEHNYLVTDDGWELLDTWPHGIIALD